MAEPEFDLVSRVVHEFAEKYYVRDHTALSDAAFDRLLDGGRTFDFSGPIDRKLLHKNLEAIFNSLPKGKVIDRNEMARAMGKSGCHYLWFC